MIKHNLRLLTALFLLLICASSASAWDVYTSSFASGNWWQEVGYAGVGNKNEVLAVAEVNPNSVQVVNTSNVIITAADVTLPTNVNNPTFTSATVNNVNVTSMTGAKLKVQFKLLGVATDADYVGKVKLWARKYDATYASNNVSKVANTFSYPFDYRDPVGKSEAILLYETSNINDGVYTCEVDEELNGNYVLYITADVKEFDTNPSAGMLPLLTVAKTELGAEFVTIQVTAESANYSATYTATYTYGNNNNRRTGTLRNQTKSGTVANVSGNMTLARRGKPAPSNNDDNGSRVLVPQRKVIYTPGDFYSKYYRIPALTKASDGTLIAISDARKYHIHDIKNDIDIVARRSTDGGKTWSLPITIAKGEGFNTTTNSCAAGHGYGDCAIASLPNGDLVATFIEGYGFAAGQSSSNLTRNFYCVSHDNGQSWSQIAEIPATLYGNERGCIAPGNMCVVKNGDLAGKVIACLRTVRTHVGDTETHRNYFLLYDPTNNSWSRLDVQYNNVNYSYFKCSSSSANDDEAHLVEVGDNTFIMSIRSAVDDGTHREFATVTYNSTTGRMQCTNKSFNGITSPVQSNGDIFNYTAVVNGAEGTYMLHSLPSQGTSDGSGGYSDKNVRSGLRVYYSQYNANSRLEWTESTFISDPYGDNTNRKETSQYNSMTQLSDGSIGILFEEYPQVIRILDDGGDFLMQQVFMQLRIGDIIPNAEAPEAPQLVAPRITPTDRSYDSHQPTDRPDPITIYNDNTVDGVTTHYTIYFYDVNGHQAANSISGDFTGASKALDWSTLTLGNQSLEDLVKDKQYPGVSIRVVAYCTKTGYKDSESVAQPYLFSTPVRNIKIVAKPVSGWGQPFISAFNIGTYEQDQVMVASVGATLVANGTPAYPYSFKGFSFSENPIEGIDGRFDIRDDLNNEQLSALSIQDESDYQISMIVPREEVLPNNSGDQLVIYAWYEANNDFGVKTRVLNNYYSVIDDETGQPYYFRNDWYPNPYKAGEDFPEPATDLKFDNVNLDKKDNAVLNPIFYNLNPQKIGLDLNVEVMPDNRGMMGYNAIVLVRVMDVDGDEVKVASASNGSMAKAPVAGGIKYYLLQGKDAPFAEGSEVYDGATAVQNWYEESAYGILPVHVKGIAFNQVVAKGLSSEQAAGACNFYVEIYFVRGNSLANVGALTNSDNYVTRVIHPVQLSTNPTTGVQDNMVTRTVKSVRYFNLAGMVSSSPFAGINIVVTDYTDGTRVTNKVVK